jgi:hypothetical protein
MNLAEVDRALRKLRLSGMADFLEARLRHAQAERLSPLDLVATLVSDDLQRREAGSWRDAISRPAFAISIAASTALNLISTRR